MNEPTDAATAEAEIRRLLAEVYKPEGVEIWMRSRSRFFGLERPNDLIQSPEGAEKVLRVAEMLAGGNF